MKTAGLAAATLETLPSRRREWATSAWCIAAAFGTYFCMYAFRKPFAVGGYEGLALWGIDYKMVLVTAQVAGYTISKFLGIKIVSELPPQRRIAGIIAMIAIAEAALLGFALTPPPYSSAFLFLNGLPLGMVFGMVIPYLEGRQTTEFLMAALCSSFILADGAAKSLGAYLLHCGVADSWMPCVAGLVAAIPMAGFVWMLSHTPPPTAEDVWRRAARAPMDGRQRRRFFFAYAPGITAVLLVYMLMTVLRSIRSDYAAELWSGLLGSRLQTPPSAYTTSEVYVALAAMAANGLCFLIRDNRRAFFVGLLIGGLGVALIVLAVLALWGGLLNAFAFMVLVGVGLYLPYVAVHTTILERLVAMTRDRGNLGYLMYLADAFGYLAYPVFMVVVWRVAGRPDVLRLFLGSCVVMAGLSWLALAMAAAYFRALRTRPSGGLSSAMGTPDSLVPVHAEAGQQVMAAWDCAGTASAGITAESRAGLGDES